MDTGDMVMLAVVAVGGYLLYQHVQQQQAAAATATTGSQTGIVLHMCPQGYKWVADSSAAGGSCQPQ